MTTTKRTTDTANEKSYDKFGKVLDQFEDKYDSVKQNVVGTADEYISKGMAGAESARDSISQFTERLTSNVEDAVHKSLKQIKTSSRDAEQLVKKYPLYTVAGAVAISFVAGMIYGKVSNRK
jgi:ElaB/YqjD/DUF883 family membrane-anchored ribosome-binding protein